MEYTPVDSFTSLHLLQGSESMVDVLHLVFHRPGIRGVKSILKHVKGSFLLKGNILLGGLFKNAWVLCTLSNLTGPSPGGGGGAVLTYIW